MSNPEIRGGVVWCWVYRYHHVPEQRISFADVTDWSTCPPLRVEIRERIYYAYACGRCGWSDRLTRTPAKCLKCSAPFETARRGRVDEIDAKWIDLGGEA